LIIKELNIRIEAGEAAWRAWLSSPAADWRLGDALVIVAEVLSWALPMPTVWSSAAKPDPGPPETWYRQRVQHLGPFRRRRQTALEVRLREQGWSVMPTKGVN
jgi:hypothetical protein